MSRPRCVPRAPRCRSAAAPRACACARLWMRGEWDEALGLIGSAGFDLEQRGAVSSAQLLACAACELYVDRGDVDAAVAALQVDDDTILSVTRHAALARARLHHALGEPDVALRPARLRSGPARRHRAGVFGSTPRSCGSPSTSTSRRAVSTTRDNAAVELEASGRLAPAGPSARCRPSGPGPSSIATSMPPAPTSTWRPPRPG